jgi:nucleoside-diphosphate-sugar epimerase
VRILLTGGSGFIGRNLLERLGAGHTVEAPSHRELDVSDSAQLDRVLEQRAFDLVIHSATPSGEHPLEPILRGFWNLARNGGRVGRILFFGSGAEYGKHRDLHEVREEEIGRVLPPDEYGFGKLLCTELARNRRNIVNLRLFGVYGRYEKYLFKFISNTIVKVLLKEEILIRQDVVFDYLYVDDLTAIVERLLETDCPFSDLNVTPTRPIRLSEIVAILQRIAERPFPVKYENPGLNLEYTGSNERLLGLLPGLQFTSYEEGIRELYDYYRDRLSHLDREAIARDEYRRRCRPNLATASRA